MTRDHGRGDGYSLADKAGIDADDELSLILLAPTVLGVLVAASPALAGLATDWLVAHKVLVAAASSPVWALPGADGAGLDARRLVILGAVVLVLVVVGGSGLRHQRSRRREYRLHHGDHK